MNFQLTKDFITLIEWLIDQKKNPELLQKIDNLLAPDIAEILELLDFEKSKYLFSLLGEEMRADILLDVEEDLRERLLEDLSLQEIVEEVIENLDSDDAADVIQELPEKKQQEVLSNIADPQQAINIADLLYYQHNSA